MIFDNYQRSQARKSHFTNWVKDLANKHSRARSSGAFTNFNLYPLIGPQFSMKIDSWSWSDEESVSQLRIPNEI